MENKDIQSKEDVLKFLTSWVEHSTCSQGKGKVEVLPTGGCGDPHYISRDQLFELIEKIDTGSLSQEDLERGEVY